MFRFWYSLFFVGAVAALSGTLAAGEALLRQPGAAAGARLLGWAVFLCADAFMLAFQDYRRQKALGNVKAPVGVYERMLRHRPQTRPEREAGQ